MKSTNITWNRDGFDVAIGAKLYSTGSYPNNTVSYTIRDDYGNSAEISIGPYSKNVSIQILGINNSVINIFNIYNVEEIKYICYDNNNGDIVHEIAIGPGILNKNGNELYYVFVSKLPNIGLWLSEINEFNKLSVEFPYQILH